MTQQAGEIVMYNGKEHVVTNEPLEKYLLKNNIKFDSYITCCYRGYYGTWAIKEDKLYLTELEATIYKEKDYITVGVDYLFNGQSEVFASWFTDEIKLCYGEYLRYAGGRYENTYEEELFLDFESGVLTGKRHFHHK